MAKLKTIVRQLSQQDYESIYSQLTINGAGKSAHLLQALRQNKTGDYKIVSQLGINPNAYYTLRSRLGQRIEEYLLEQIESPRTALLRKVANLHEVVFTNRHTIAIATLKSLERELIEYDLSNELMLVYKYLKRMHAHDELAHEYSKRYNQHMACVVAMDKADHILIDYFAHYAKYYLEGNKDELEAMKVLKENVIELSGMFHSHRLKVFETLLVSFDRLFVQSSTKNASPQPPLEDTFLRLQETFDLYSEDPLYPHMVIVLHYLRYCYYCQHRIEDKSDALYEEMVSKVAPLLEHYSTYTFPSHVLRYIIEQSLRSGKTQELHARNEELFKQYTPDSKNIASYLCYATYRGLCGYYAGYPAVLGYWMQKSLNELRLKNYPRVQCEIKATLALHHVLQNDYAGFSHVCNSLQRQMRLLGDQKPPHLVTFIKLLRLTFNTSHKAKENRMESLIQQLQMKNYPFYSALAWLEKDGEFLHRLQHPH